MGKRERIIGVWVVGWMLLIMMALPVEAIVWCHDYTLWRATGEDANNTSPAELRSRLGGLHYKRFPFTNAARMPRAQGKL
ncbi:MAG: hypothetical protein JXI43_09935, partial [Tissierellales bacterium]|nr:hypothetical protein [Tissierellales bacterium]